MQCYKIIHRTYYNYSSSVTLGAHNLLLRPRESHELRIESFTLKSIPEAKIFWHRDVEDNSVAIATFEIPTQQLFIESEVIIQHYNESPLDFIVSDYAINYPFKYLVNDNNDIDNELLKKHCDIIIRMLNKVIDYNDYSSIEGSYSGNKRRSIGVGIQGFADLLNRLGHSFDSQEAKNINIELFKSINDYLWNSSIELNEKYKIDLSSQFKDNFQHKQAVNTTVSALMPTAGTSVLTSSSEMFEPYTSNILVRKLTNSEFVVWNKNLVKDLEKENLFTEEIKSEIIKQEGSVQFLNTFTKREVYKTVWEYKQKDLIDLCIDRQPYISMSQSMNLYYAEPTYNKISSALLYGWKKGLNTGVYYTRTKNKVKANTQIINTVEDKNYKIECVGGCNG